MAICTRRIFWSCYAIAVVAACFGYIMLLRYAWNEVGCNSLAFRSVSCETIREIEETHRRRHGGQKEIAYSVWGCTEVVIKRAKNTGEEDLVSGVRAHAFVLEHLEHPNLVQIFGKCETESSIKVVEKSIDGETLKVHNNDYSLDNSLLYALSISRLAKYFMNSPLGPLMHCDFVPHNFIITENGDITLIDVDTIWSFQRNNMFKDPFVPRYQDHSAPNTIVHRDKANSRASSCYKDSDCYMYCVNSAPESMRCDKENSVCASFDIRAFVYAVCADLIEPLLYPYEFELPVWHKDILDQCLAEDPNLRISIEDLVTNLNRLYQETLQRHPPIERRFGLNVPGIL